MNRTTRDVIRMDYTEFRAIVLDYIRNNLQLGTYYNENDLQKVEIQMSKMDASEDVVLDSNSTIIITLETEL